MRFELESLVTYAGALNFFLLHQKYTMPLVWGLGALLWDWPAVMSYLVLVAGTEKNVDLFVFKLEKGRSSVLHPCWLCALAASAAC